MKKYEVAIPITGFQVIEVEAWDEKHAIELVANGEWMTDYYDNIEMDTDSNSWEVEEVLE